MHANSIDGETDFRADRGTAMGHSLAAADFVDVFTPASSAARKSTSVSARSPTTYRACTHILTSQQHSTSQRSSIMQRIYCKSKY
eukprot:1990496-Pyramimonas_sp.AAC.1